MQSTRKLSKDFAEMKTLRMERDETLHLKKDKQAQEDNTMKRLSEMENDLRKEKFPHIAHYKALKLPVGVDAKDLVKSQLVIACIDGKEYATLSFCSD